MRCHIEKIYLFLFAVVMPLFVGGIIYLLFRSKSLYMFSWFRFIGFDAEINIFRGHFLPLRKNIPNWIIYSLPNALWAFSMLSFFTLFWKDDRRFLYLWIFISTCFTLIMELFQWNGLIPGTFSFDDLFLLGLSYLIFVIIFRKQLISNTN